MTAMSSSLTLAMSSPWRNKTSSISSSISPVNSNVLISIGANTEHERQILRAKSTLRRAFPDIQFTHAVITPAYGMPEDTLQYINMLARFTTPLDEDALITQLKDMEKRLGNSAALRSAGTVMMDIDLLSYNDHKRHLEDWKRPYIKELLRS